MRLGKHIAKSRGAGVNAVEVDRGSTLPRLGDIGPHHERQAHQTCTLFRLKPTYGRAHYASRLPRQPQSTFETVFGQHQARSVPAQAGNLGRGCVNFLYIFKAAREPGRTRRRLGAWPCRLCLSAGDRARPTPVGRREGIRHRGAARRRVQSREVPHSGRVPLAGSRLARGPRTGPRDGPLRAGRCRPSADPGYEAPPPHKSGTGQLSSPAACLVTSWLQIAKLDQSALSL